MVDLRVERPNNTIVVAVEERDVRLESSIFPAGFESGAWGSGNTVLRGDHFVFGGVVFESKCNSKGDERVSL